MYFTWDRLQSPAKQRKRERENRSGDGVERSVEAALAVHVLAVLAFDDQVHGADVVAGHVFACASQSQSINPNPIHQLTNPSPTFNADNTRPIDFFWRVGSDNFFFANPMAAPGL